MSEINKLITDNIDVWTSAIKKRNATGRGSSKKIELTGVKKLRELILELAVRGKLVAQDSNDEPASLLLEKIADEKAQLITDKKIKKQKPLAEIADEEKSFKLPKGWEWSQLTNITNYVNGYAFKSKDFTDNGVGIIKIGDIQEGVVSTSNMSRVPRDVTDAIDNNFQVIKGDLLIAMSGATTGKLGFNTSDEIFYLNQRVGKIQSFGVLLKYLYFPLTTKIAENLSKAIGSAIPNISTTQINEIVIAVPPLAEQHRIVAKVDELMALCDQLEQQTEQSLTAYQTLVEELLNTLTQSVNADDFQESWQRIADHFDVLFTTEASIDQLKQTILQLAVMGKLVPQNPSEEPASVLLEKIVEEKAQLIADKKIKKQKPLPAITDEEKPFELPSGWEWATLSHIGVFTGGKTPSKANSDYWNGDIPWVTPKDMKVEEIFDSEDHVTKLAVTDGLAQIGIESLLFVARSGILRRKFPVAITKSVCTVNQDLKVLSLIDKSIANYVLLMMKGFEMYILENLTKIGTTVESLRFEDFSKHYFIMPPLKEQHRIVAKVDELMALCDQLKARLSDAQTTQLHLADAVVENALN